MVALRRVRFVEQCLKLLSVRKRHPSREALLKALENVARRLGQEGRGLDVDRPGFAAFFCERVPELGGDPNEVLGRLAAADLLLAHACLDGDGPALRLLENEALPKVALAVRRVDSSPGFVRDATAATRERLLVASPTRGPGLLGYAGIGPLNAFAMVVAMRVAADLKRAPKLAQTLDPAVGRVADPGRGAETNLFKRQLGPKVQRALTDAAAALTDRERTLLRLHLVSGLSAERLAKLYQVHRATTTRWITEARRKVLDHVNEQLQRELEVGQETFAEVKAELIDGLDITLSGVLSP